MPGAYSIRESLQGALQDFIRNNGFSNTHLEELIRECVGLLAAYREEGELLFPEVYVFAKPEAFKALAPSAQQITIGRISISPKSAAPIIKKCAPLARGGWAQFVVCEGETLRFGLFRAVRHSLATTTEESLHDLGFEMPAMLIRNRGHLVVDLRGTNNRTFTVSLRTEVAQESDLSAHVQEFVQAATAGIDNEVRLSFLPYLKRLLVDLLQRCHGTLLAVADEREMTKEIASHDCIPLIPPIAIGELYAAALVGPTADALADLIAAEQIVEGMIHSDGLVIFGTNGSVLAFKMFLRPDETERLKIGDSGGGRQRAYELMELRLGNPFKAVFFRSQDGATKCKGVPNEPAQR